MTSANRTVIETYLGTMDRSKVSPLLADDVEWVEWAEGVPSTGVRTRGKTAFLQNFGDDQLKTEIVRLIEEGDTVVVEGTVRVFKKDGAIIKVQFVDIFELANGKIQRLSSFGALLKDPP